MSVTCLSGKRLSVFFICSGDFNIYRRKKWKEKHYSLQTPSLSYSLYPLDPNVLYYNRTRSHHRRAMNDTTFCSFMEEIAPNFPVLWIWIRIRKRIWKKSFQIRIRAALDLKWNWCKTTLKNLNIWWPMPLFFIYYFTDWYWDEYILYIVFVLEGCWWCGREVDWKLACLELHWRNCE